MYDSGLKLFVHVFKRSESTRKIPCIPSHSRQHSTITSRLEVDILRLIRLTQAASRLRNFPGGFASSSMTFPARIRSVLQHSQLGTLSNSPSLRKESGKAEREETPLSHVWTFELKWRMDGPRISYTARAKVV